jgi:hypothetical protein
LLGRFQVSRGHTHVQSIFPPPLSHTAPAFIEKGPQSSIDSTVPHGWHYYWKSTHLPDLSNDLIDVLAEHAFASASPRSYAAMFHLGGAVSRVPQHDTAFPHRQASHAITLDAVWKPGENFADNDTAWSKGFFAALDRFRQGVYVNFLDADEAPDRIREPTATPTNGWSTSRPSMTPTTSSTTTTTSAPDEATGRSSCRTRSENGSSSPTRRDSAEALRACRASAGECQLNGVTGLA